MTVAVLKSNQRGIPTTEAVRAAKRLAREAKAARNKAFGGYIGFRPPAEYEHDHAAKASYQQAEAVAAEAAEAVRAARKDIPADLWFWEERPAIRHPDCPQLDTERQRWEAYTPFGRLAVITRHDRKERPWSWEVAFASDPTEFLSGAVESWEEALAACQEHADQPR